VEVSPSSSSCLVAILRSTRRMILPLRVLGRPGACGRRRRWVALGGGQRGGAGVCWRGDLCDDAPLGAPRRPGHPPEPTPQAAAQMQRRCVTTENRSRLKDVLENALLKSTAPNNAAPKRSTQRQGNGRPRPPPRGLTQWMTSGAAKAPMVARTVATSSRRRSSEWCSPFGV
jgi:hypothetical protein